MVQAPERPCFWLATPANLDLDQQELQEETEGEVIDFTESQEEGRGADWGFSGR